jgi:uncharacterized membrane protein YgdD (TMEM256/DUF423 family)
MRWVLLAAAVIGAWSILAGTFGAHGLEGSVTAQRLEVWKTSVQYPMAHGLALLALVAVGGGVAAPVGCWRVVAWGWGTGAVVFGLTLQLLVLTGWRWWGAVTPVGGVLMLAGWVALGVVAARRVGPRDAGR